MSKDSTSRGDLSLRQSSGKDKNGLKDDENEDERELLVFKSLMCEQSGRFDDMVQVMNELCKKYDDLSHNEKNLLSCAYKNVIGSRRTSWRILNDLTLRPETATAATTATKLELNNEQKRHGGNNSNNINKDNNINDNNSNNNNNNVEDTGNQDVIIRLQQIKKPKFSGGMVEQVLKTIEFELKDHCCNIIRILSDRLIPSISASGESRVFYQKMKGDYLRYLCEISPEGERKEISNESLLSYKAACDKAMIELPPTHPVRLGLMLNFSVFYYDIMKSPERSCRLAKQAFDDAIAELDTLSEESYRDSTIIMQLLRDNLNLWQSEQSLQQQQHQQPANLVGSSIVNDQ